MKYLCQKYIGSGIFPLSTVAVLKIIQKVVTNDTNRFVNFVHVYDMQATTFLVKQRNTDTKYNESKATRNLTYNKYIWI